MNKRLILVVDDEENTRLLIRFALTKAGYEIAEAKTGVEALDFLTISLPDLIIVDMVMPDMDGFSLIKKIKTVSVYAGIPVVVSSGKGGMKEYFELEEALYRPNAFLVKPYKMKDLIETVKKFV